MIYLSLFSALRKCITVLNAMLVFHRRVSDIWAKSATSGGALFNSEGTVLLKMLLTPSKSRKKLYKNPQSVLSLFHRAHSLTRRCPAKVHTSVPFHCHLCHSHTKGQSVKECAAQDCSEHLHYSADQKKKKKKSGESRDKKMYKKKSASQLHEEI